MNHIVPSIIVFYDIIKFNHYKKSWLCMYINTLKIDDKNWILVTQSMISLLRSQNL